MGRPPSSGYCHTCRSRRVKCDRGTPSCQRCLKSGHTCRGYEVLFRTAKIGASEGHTIALRPSRDLVTSNATNRVLSKSGLTPIPPYIHYDLALRYFLDRYRWAHWWKSIVLDGFQAHPESTLHISSKALVIGYFGYKENKANLKSMGTEIYGESMRRVRRILEHSTQTALADVARTVIILGMYPYALDEVLSLEHITGVGAILQSIGPEHFESKEMTRIFRSCRSSIICTAFALHRRTFLEEEAWATLPFRNSPKTWMDRLLDILSHLPGLWEDINIHKFQPLSRTPVENRHHIEILTRQLRAWRKDWDLAHQYPASLAFRANTRTAKYGADKELAMEVLQREIRFQTLDEALEISAHHAAAIYLSRLTELTGHAQATLSFDVRQLRGYLFDTGQRPNSPLLQADMMPAPWELAMEAIQISGYVADELRRAAVPELVPVAPLGILYCAVKAMPILGDHLSSAISARFSSRALTELDVYGIWGG